MTRRAFPAILFCFLLTFPPFLKGEVGISFDPQEGIHNTQSADDKKIGGAMSVVVHTAFHIGAIRQILRVVKS